MRTSFLVSFSLFVMACGGSASPEKCEKVAEHVVSLSLKSAVGDAAAASGSTDELIATADAAKIASAEARNSPQFKKIQEGCQKVPESIADCMLAATSVADLGACRPK